MSQSGNMPHGGVLICSVGGSPEPVILSIDEHQPDYVIYVASRGTREKIEEIRQKLSWRGVRQNHTITLGDYEDLLACVRDMREGLRKGLEDMGVAADTPLAADITGGTKVMSAALTLVMMEYANGRFSYVGGTKRGKEGVGVVESGYEKIRRMDNPWEVMGFREVHDLAQAFNSGQYAVAGRIATLLKDRQTAYSKFYLGIDCLVSAFVEWDIFNYKGAASLLVKALGILKDYNNDRYPGFPGLFARFTASQKALEAVLNDAAILRGGKSVLPLPPECGRSYLIDLVSNARRRAEFGHYDDAVARLYSAIEKTARMALARKGKDNSRLGADDLREAGGDFLARYAIELEENGFVRMPLFESFRYLCALDKNDYMARVFTEKESELGKVLEARNMSLLAHGYNPVKKDAYDRLLAIALEFMDIGLDELFTFPRLQVHGLLFC